ncbi:glycosyltransferase family 2 protein [Pseudooceanicola sp. C21-150M6]|uniref:glycosyltransferase family 2 protein n=1 Tax=Pseudooceanicola sp. C21-150M6 TaxID=3434355 RepID=UPI003D7FC118
MRCLAVLTVRNEGAYLLEWLAHHRAVGFTDFLIFSNDCQDGTDDMLDQLQEMGLVTHIRNDGPYDQGGIQFTALKMADKMDIVKEADWILTLDVDEFVNIHVGERNLRSLFDALPDATAITLTWRLFGCGGKARFVDEPVTHNFIMAAPEIMFWPWRSAMFKTLYRNDGTYSKLGVHRPRSPDPTRVDATRWFDCHGRELDEQFKRTRIFNTYGRPNYRLAQLNHYPLGSMENYVVKADRGRAVHSDHMLGVDYWVERNFSATEDTSILNMSDPMLSELKRLKADPQLGPLHQAAVAWRKERFEYLMKQEPYRALFGRLLMTPPTRVVPLNEARFLVRYATMAREEAQTPPQVAKD